MCTAVLGSKVGAHQLQGAVSPISTVFRAVTEDVTLYMEGVSTLTVFLHILQNKSHSQSGFCHGHWVTGSLEVWSRGQQQFTSVITWSQTVFCWSHIVTPVTALSIAHIGVTIPLIRSIIDFLSHLLGVGGRGFPFPVRYPS